MYRILLVTDQEHLLKVYEGFAEWNALGFAPPLLLTDVQQAMERVRAGEVQAVSYALPKDAGQAFFSFMTHFPGIRGMEAASDAERLRRAVSGLRRQLREGEQDEPGADVMALMQREFFHEVISGVRIPEEALRTRIATLSLALNLTSPVVMAELCLPEGQEYINQVWRYGRGRLETALHNFFDRDWLEGRFIAEMESLAKITLLFCPKIPLTLERANELFYDHLTRAREEVKLYLDLGMQVRYVWNYDSLTELTGGQQGREAYRAEGL